MSLSSTRKDWAQRSCNYRPSYQRIARVAVDGVGSRHPIDHGTALTRLQQAGALLTTVEAAGFEWIATAEHPSFKAFSQLVQSRSRRLREVSE
jgi:hypothetical protein